MVGSLKSSLILAFVACQMVCVTVKILPSKSSTSSKSPYPSVLDIEIIHGGYPMFRTELPSRTVSLGVQCLKEKENFYLKIDNEKKNYLSSKFFLAFDLENYGEYEGFDKDVQGIVGQEFCITWGTYTPTSDNKSKAVTFYFNIYKNKAYFLNRYFYFFEITNNTAKYMVKLHLAWLQPDAAEPKKEEIEIIYLGYADCNNSKHSRLQESKTFSFRENRAYVISDNGVFVIAQLIEKTDPLTNEVTRALETLKKYPTSQLNSNDISGWSRTMKCEHEVFKYEIGELTLQNKGSQILI